MATIDAPEVKIVESQNSKIKKLVELLNSAKKIAIFSHPYVDPDAIASIMSMEWIIHKINPEAEIAGFFNGAISHPQNIAMVNLLDPNLKNVTEYKNEEWDLRILVDTIPINAGITDKISFDIVIDHHKEIPNGGFNGLFINVKAGSCCATIYDIIKQLKLKFDNDNDIDTKTITAMLVGISTDTESLMSDDCTNYEFDAWTDLFPIRDSVALKKIVNFERPKFWIEHKASAVEKSIIEEGVAIVGLGIIPSRHRDLIADMSDNMVSWEDVNTAIAFAIVDGDRVEGCVRSHNASVMVPQLCKSLATKHGNGGGKLGKGAYHYTLGGTAFEEEDDDNTKSEIWKVLSSKETKRILRIIHT